MGLFWKNNSQSKPKKFNRKKFYQDQRSIAQSSASGKTTVTETSYNWRGKPVTTETTTQAHGLGGVTQKSRIVKKKARRKPY